MRLAKLRSVLREQSLDAILVGQPENRRYLSGFSGSAAWLVISSSRAVLATDSRYYEQVVREAAGFELAKIRYEFSDLLPGLLADLEVRRLGFESRHLTVEQWSSWRDLTLGVEWVPLQDTVESLRAIKDEGELETLRRAVALADAAFAHLLEVIRPGMSEREAAWEIESYMRSHGAGKAAFDLIVAAGANGAMAHARAGEHRIQPGEPVVVDIGCVVDGYCSDMTRTFCLGQPGAKYLEVWDLVLSAQEAAEAVLRAGMSGVEADAVARERIAASGYGDFFGHGLGHGVGLSVHECPWASRLSKDILVAGMTLTVEPGIYLPAQFGVRLEDLVVIQADGIEILTNTPKMPVVGGQGKI